MREPLAQQAREIRGTESRPGAGPSPEERSAELERMEGIPRRAVVEPHQRRPWKRRPEPCRQEPMGCSETHGPHGHQLGVRELEAAAKIRPASGEHGDRLAS